MSRTTSFLEGPFHQLPNVETRVEHSRLELPQKEIPAWQMFHLLREFQRIVGGFVAAGPLKPIGFVEIITKQQDEGIPNQAYQIAIYPEYHSLWMELVHESNRSFRGMTAMYPDIRIHIRVSYTPESGIENR